MTQVHVPEDDVWARRHNLPPGGEQLFVPMADNWPVRCVHWRRRDEGPGHVLMLTGRADFVEKYAETLHDLVDAGWGVTIFDWRGQGLSRRLGKTPQHGASPGFGVWLGDLRTLLAWLQDRVDGPITAMAHSMGGHLLLRHLAAGNSPITRAVLLAPMVGVAAKPLGPAITALVARWQVVRGRGEDYVWGGGPWQPGRAGDQRQLWLTSDPERYADESWWIGNFPALALGSVTWGWLDDAFASIGQLRAAGVPEAIAVPCLFLMPQRDGLVDSAAARALARRVPGARVIDYPGAGHELLREAEPLRSEVLAAALAHLAEGQG